ncbi:hypothetical protein Tco_1275148 [Tanacetum coccineum]
MSKRASTCKSTKGESSSSEETVKDRVRNFGVFESETHRINYEAFVYHPIHSEVVIDWSLFADNGLERGFFDSINTDPFFGPQWENLFWINEPVYRELVRDFFATYEFEAATYMNNPSSWHWLSLDDDLVCILRLKEVRLVWLIIIEQRVNVNQKARILELKRRNHKDYCFDNRYAVSIKEDTAYPCPELHSASTKERSNGDIGFAGEMDDPDITMEEYVQLESERALRNGKVYNWETATYGKIWYDEDVHYLRFFETEFPAIVYNDALASKSDFSSEPTISPQHVDEIKFEK